MDHGSLPFSILNERLRPHSTQERLRAPPSIWEDRQSPGSHRRGSSSSSSAMPTRDQSTVYQVRESEPESEDSKTRSDETAGEDSETGSLDSWSSMNEEQADRSDLLNLLNQCLVPAMRTTVPEPLGDGERSRGGQGSPHAESIGSIPSITVETQQEADPHVSAGEVVEQNRRSYVDRSLPDLIRGSGRPLSRRRTLGPVSDTVTEEVLSILRLLRSLSEPQHGLTEVPPGAGRLDAALGQLQTVARTLAISHGQQPSGTAKRSEDRAILEQALRDRDEAIERKKGMEAELLRNTKSFPAQGFGSLPRSWKDKFRRGKTHDVQQASGHETTGFQT
ncbi:hypothetical protein CRUP_028883, partial [Coryphaenoides rupestris]